MNELDLQRRRAELLRAAINKVSDGNVTTFGKRLGYKDGAYIRQMLSGTRPIREKTIFAIEELPGLKGFFTTKGGPDLIVENDDGSFDLVEIKRGNPHPADVEEQLRKYEFSIALDRCLKGGMMTGEAGELVKSVVRADIAGVTDEQFRSVRQILDLLTNAQKAKGVVNQTIAANEEGAELPSDREVNDAIERALPGAETGAAEHERARNTGTRRKGS